MSCIYILYIYFIIRHLLLLLLSLAVSLFCVTASLLLLVCRLRRNSRCICFPLLRLVVVGM